MRRGGVGDRGWAGQQSPVPGRMRLLGLRRPGAHGCPEGGSACMGKLNSRRGFHIGLSVDARRGGGGGVIWGLEERVRIPRRWVNSFGKLTKIWSLDYFLPGGIKGDVLWALRSQIQQWGEGSEKDCGYASLQPTRTNVWRHGASAIAAQNWTGAICAATPAKRWKWMNSLNLKTTMLRH